MFFKEIFISLGLIIFFLGIAGGVVYAIKQFCDIIFAIRLELFSRKEDMSDSDLQNLETMSELKFWKTLSKKYGFDNKNDYVDYNIALRRIRILKMKKGYWSKILSY